MKNRQSYKTVALWLFLIVLFFAIYQTVSRTADGQHLTLSEFVAVALPVADGTGTVQSGRMTQVVVREKLVEYAIRPPGERLRAVQGQQQPFPSGDLADPSVSGELLDWYYAHGDVSALSGNGPGQTVLSTLAHRGVRVSFEASPYEDYEPRGEERPFSMFLGELQRLRAPTGVVSISIRGKEILGELKNGDRFTTVGDLGLYKAELIARGVRVTEENDQESSLWMSILGTWLPMIFIFLVFFLFMRQLQAGGGKAMSFGKSRHRLLNESANKVTFKDIAGIDEAKEELEEIIHFLKEPKKFTRLGGRIPKGVLLMGPPGTGKTLLARGVAGESGVPFFTISGSDFVEMFVGVGASRVRDLFEQGKKNAPCIIFIDEIDAVGRHRGAGLGGGHDEREQTLNQLLVEMDGFESNEGVILIAATNRPDVLDPALMRPGRFDRRVVVSRPDIAGRLAILKVHSVKKRISRGVELDVIARGTPGFSGADLENLVNEAALLAARRDKDAIDLNDLEDAKDKVLMGVERRSVVLSEEDKMITAVHEAGHTLVAALTPACDPVHKVTIIPRGMALGLTWTVPESDQFNLSEAQVQARITMAMGGRVAEAEYFDRITTGAGNDIEQATKLARRMVCEWGMSELGPVALSKPEGNVFLGRDLGTRSDFSEQTRGEADAQVRKILDDAYARAEVLVKENRVALDALTEALLEFESIDGKEVHLLIDGASLEELRAHRAHREELRAQAEKGSAVEAARAPVAPAETGDLGGADGGLGPELPEPAGGMRQRLPDGPL